MTNLEWLGRLYDSVFWANERVLELPVGEAHESARRYLHHILAAERVWLLRLRGEESTREEIWPHLTDEEARSMAAENRSGYRRFLERLTEDDLETPVEYVNQRGLRYRTATADILIHVAMHGAYHRGQLARAVREAGAQPINTDFIHYVRQLEAPGGA